MPFGAEFSADGQTRFRIWAPGAQHVDLCLQEETRLQTLAMSAQTGGWFELFAPAKNGGRYCYRIDGEHCVPDPASRFQPAGVHGYSEILDADAWPWSDQDWTGRPWEKAVIYELHIGSFTSEGSFRAAADKLDHLIALGITAIQLMPVAEFPGSRDWGYDGVQLFAPDSSYGTPSALKYLVQSAHAKGLMVFLDVVYNHFGPEGNYLQLYAPAFFSAKHQTPWGKAINFDGENSHWVRQFFIHNALYWLEEFHFDGLRLDAVHSIFDETHPDILEEMAEAVQKQFSDSRHVHLVLENDCNASHYLQRDSSGKASRYVAQWNDDIHHALHVLLTGETQGYYADYSHEPLRQLCRCLCEGFAYQGETSAYRNGKMWGEPSGHLPPLAFVSFLQNHDQIGNRALGERIGELAPAQAIRAVTALLLLAPFPPLLFMGQEWGSLQRFPYFCNFAPDLAKQVREGRRNEFARFPEFADADSLQRIPDPAAESTYQQSLLDWDSVRTAEGQQWLEFHRRLLAVRKLEIAPRLMGIQGGNTRFRLVGDHAFTACWRLGDGSNLHLAANLGFSPSQAIKFANGQLLFATLEPSNAMAQTVNLPGWSVIWKLQEPRHHEQ
ncbi:MAG: malto-oligosyltrehalose trehalohydrolase [Methylomonas sp.]